MKVNQRLLFSFDWLLFLAVLALVGIGLIAIWSTTTGTSLDPYFARQLLYAGLGAAVFLVILYFDYHFFADFVSIAYGIGIVALVAVLLFSRPIHGNKSWLMVGGVAFQPSEFVKLIVLVALAKYYAESEREHLELKELLIGGLIVGFPMYLVIRQPDLGTAITFVSIYAVLSYLAGVQKKHLLVILIAGLLAAPAGWLMLQDYQKGRIQTVLNPVSDPRKLGYQTIQSEIAIGSGRFMGKGFRQGSQGQLGFLPARHTDFVFAVWSEERGFLGSTVLLGLFLVVTIRLLRAVREAKDRVGAMILTGVAGVMLFHVAVNVGMVVGLLPIIGIPLPFVSAGGSALISNFAAIGLCMNIRMRRYVN